MKPTSSLILTEVASLYDKFATPFTLGDPDVASTSTLLARRTTDVPGPLVQVGTLPSAPLKNFPMPEISITYLPNAIVTMTGAVIYNEIHIISETIEGSLEDNGFIELSGAINYQSSQIDEMDEIVVCVNRNGTWNYSLFLSEVVPLALVCSMNPHTAMLRAPMFFRSFMDQRAVTARKELLAQFGLTQDRIFTPTAPLTRYRGVVLAKVNDRYKNHRVSQLMPHIAGKLRAELATPYTPISRRLYISRQASTNRRIDNFEEFSAKILQPFGLLPVELDTMPLSEQVDLFAKADLIVAEHGAGLVNTMFMRPGSTVVEMTPGPMVGRWMYRMIAHHNRLNYCFGSFETPEGWTWHRDNLVAPCALYRRLLEHV